MKADSKNYIGQIKELLRAPDFGEREPKVLLSVTTPSAISFYAFQNLQYQLLQNTVLLVRASLLLVYTLLLSLH